MCVCVCIHVAQCVSVYMWLSVCAYTCGLIVYSVCACVYIHMAPNMSVCNTVIESNLLVVFNQLVSIYLASFPSFSDHQKAEATIAYCDWL